MTDIINGQPPVPEIPKFVEGKCTKCSLPISIPFPPFVVNENIIVSSVIIPHTKGAECPNCKQYYNIIIMPSQINLALVPMTKPDLGEEDEKKVLPFDSGHLARLPKIQ